jgi:NAD(P)-dependent dehydrogenase (short-subunit alcohol dehydrogenase family)
MELKDRRAIVTGAGRGIGRAIAMTLAAEGAAVALMARTASQLEAVAGEIAAAGGTAVTVTADLANPSQIRGAIQGLLERWGGGVDILVNNAGVLGPVGLTSDVEAAAWMETININLGGCFLCAHQVLPPMMEQGHGKIINLSGGGAVSPRPRFTAYGASKAAIVRFTESLAEEVAEYGIDVNAIAPGAINTDMLQDIISAGGAAGAEEAEARQLASDGCDDVGRAAALALYLASPRSDGLSGRLLSAVWDTWQEIDIAKVMASESYTVRRLKADAGADSGGPDQC